MAMVCWLIIRKHPSWVTCLFVDCFNELAPYKYNSFCQTQSGHYHLGNVSGFCHKIDEIFFHYFSHQGFLHYFLFKQNFTDALNTQHLMSRKIIWKVSRLSEYSKINSNYRILQNIYFIYINTKDIKTILDIK